MAVTHSKAAREAMDRAVRGETRHKVIAYYDSDKGLKARLLEPREGDDVSALLKLVVGPKVSYLGCEPQDDCLRARAANQGMDVQAFIHQRVAMIDAGRDTLKKAMEGEWLMDRLNVQKADQGYFRWSNPERPNDWLPRTDDLQEIKPTDTPFMDLARQATRGADFERKLEQVRKDQEELCGVKVFVDPAVGCDTFVISTGRRAGKTAMRDAILAMGPGARAGKPMEQLMAEAMERLWGGTAKAPAQDPSAARDEIAMARSCKPVNRPHKDEKPANPYPPAHPKAAPAGLLAVSAMEARMGNRWAP